MQKQGFIQLLIIIVLTIVIVSLLGVSLGDLFDNQTLKNNFSFAYKWVKYGWDNYFYPYIWQPLIKAAGKIRK